MASDEIILDVANYHDLPAAPTREDLDTHGEAYFHGRLREREHARASNLAKQQFVLDVHRFLDLKDLAQEAGGDETSAQEGLRLAGRAPALTETEKARLLAVAGLVLTDPLDGTPSSGGDDDDEPDAAFPARVAAPFHTALVRALSEHDAHPALFREVYASLKHRARPGAQGELRLHARQVGEIGRALIAQGTDPDDPWFAAVFDRALARSLAQSAIGRPAALDLGDLGDRGEDIIADNIRALSAIYFAAMLEELKLFAVMDRVVEQFFVGAISLGPSDAGDRLYRYYRETPSRLGEPERRGLYARSFGLAQGSVDEAMPNRRFTERWIRFLSAVNLSARELGTGERRAVSSQYVFDTARDLAINLSRHGYGLAHVAAVELRDVIGSITDALSRPEVLIAYGVGDVWQLVERVSQLYLGGAVDGVRLRAMGASGAAILQWLAGAAPSLTGASRSLAIDAALTSQVERWLAVTAGP